MDVPYFKKKMEVPHSVLSKELSQKRALLFENARWYQIELQ